MFFEENEKSSIRDRSKELKLSTGTVWRVLITKLKLKAYRLRRAQCLTAGHVESRLLPCRFWNQFPEEWVENVIWIDEKMFVFTLQLTLGLLFFRTKSLSATRRRLRSAWLRLAWLMADAFLSFGFKKVLMVKSTWTSLRKFSGLL